MEMKTIKQNELNDHAIRYTVKLNNLYEGTITFQDGRLIKVGEQHKNVQFIDEFNNKVGRNGRVEKILNTEFYNSGEWSQCKIEGVNA